jgi:hypothetical protein
MDDRNKLRAKAAHYRELARQMTDQRLIDVLEELAGEYEQAALGGCETATFHGTPGKGRA